MTRKKEKKFLIIITTISLIILPFAIIKRSFKDWIIVYLVSVIGNSFADRLLVSRGYLEYKIRPFPKKISIHLPFDYVHYPLLLLYFNQLTLNSKPLGILLKVFPFVIPQVLFETYLAKTTDLITWKNGWTWHHSFISLFVKLLLCRAIIAVIRTVNKGTISTN
ncbi:CBO0543 family protein [Salipaludibacillus sp. HK11]|uniref:CBO0543 family protein n=1 Tax=Salipaludibacillus sp. HK11 TaxID=3394320 RepID=UPI0039FC8391